MDQIRQILICYATLILQILKDLQVCLIELRFDHKQLFLHFFSTIEHEFRSKASDSRFYTELSAENHLLKISYLSELKR
jgi:hypothetical protein